MPTDTTQQESSLDQAIRTLKEVEKIADKNSSTILYTTGIAILIVTYTARYFPFVFRHMEYNEFIFSCVFAALFFVGAAALRLHIHRLTLDSACQKDSELSQALEAAAASSRERAEQAGARAG